MEFVKFVEWLFYATIGGAAVYGVSILAHLKTSIDILNEKIAVVIEKSSWHERLISKNSEDIEYLKSKV